MDPKTANWIANNTKPCPKCGMGIQKVGGCMQITCTCNHQFCYNCLHPWIPHHWSMDGVRIIYKQCNKETNQKDINTDINHFIDSLHENQSQETKIKDEQKMDVEFYEDWIIIN